MKTGRKRFFILDGYALLFRAHFALIRNPLITSYGLHTSALFGFVNQLLKIMKDETPDYFACAFDSKGKTFRHDMYEDYKANRPPMPEELQIQLPHLWEILEAMNIPVLKKQGVEADDIIGTLAVNAQKKGFDTYIVSGDKDFMQLINDNIYLYAPGTKKTPNPIIYDSEKVQDKWGVPPNKIIDLLGLMGDSSDNVPGVAGVGQKTAVKLINEYGSLKGALDNADKVANKRARTGLLDGVEKGLLSRKLVTIMLDVEINSNIDDFIRQEMNNELCVIKFKELEFQAFVKQFEQNISTPEVIIEVPKKDYKIILKKNQLDQLIIDLRTSKLFSFHFETARLNHSDIDIVGISFSISSNTAWYIPIVYPEKKGNNFGSDDLEVVLGEIKNILEDPLKAKVGHNIKFDMYVLKRFGIVVQGVAFDTMIAAHLLNPSARSISLDSLSLEHLNHETIKIEELIGKGKNQISISNVTLDQTSFYSSENADISLQLAKTLKARLKDNTLYEFFKTIELSLLPVLANMEYNGVFVDSNMLLTMSKDTGRKLDILKGKIFDIAGKDFNINSTQQLANILFDELELPQIKKRSTAEEVLKKLRPHHELPALILEYRKYYKLKNTYLDSLQELINNNTSRIHSTFNQTIASTGRLSSTNPNFQNIPIRTDEGREIRKSFIAQDNNWKILSADYSQVELRMMAHFSKDNGLIEAFNNAEDIHSKTASLVFNVPIEMVQPEMRRTAKVVNFGIMYGA
ncbi:MAG: DNA polymerase I, partial [Candidatus Marinimicrobia bacterium]|nr:DNA polymerase I [Candidatus Neomarinimicrobiota bacterium]